MYELLLDMPREGSVREEVKRVVKEAITYYE